MIGLWKNYNRFISPNEEGFIIDGFPEGSTLLIFDKTGKIVFNANPNNDENCLKGVDDEGRLLNADKYLYAIDNPRAGELAAGFVFLKG